MAVNNPYLRPVEEDRTRISGVKSGLSRFTNQKDFDKLNRSLRGLAQSFAQKAKENQGKEDQLIANQAAIEATTVGIDFQNRFTVNASDEEKKDPYTASSEGLNKIYKNLMRKHGANILLKTNKDRMISNAILNNLNKLNPALFLISGKHLKDRGEELTAQIRVQTLDELSMNAKGPEADSQSTVDKGKKAIREHYKGNKALLREELKVFGDSAGKIYLNSISEGNMIGLVYRVVGELPGLTSEHSNKQFVLESEIKSPTGQLSIEIRRAEKKTQDQFTKFYKKNTDMFRQGDYAKYMDKIQVYYKQKRQTIEKEIEEFIKNEGSRRRKFLGKILNVVRTRTNVYEKSNDAYEQKGKEIRNLTDPLDLGYDNPLQSEWSGLDGEDKIKTKGAGVTRFSVGSVKIQGSAKESLEEWEKRKKYEKFGFNAIYYEGEGTFTVNGINSRLGGEIRKEGVLKYFQDEEVVEILETSALTDDEVARFEKDLPQDKVTNEHIRKHVIIQKGEDGKIYTQYKSFFLALMQNPKYRRRYNEVILSLTKSPEEEDYVLDKLEENKERSGRRLLMLRRDKAQTKVKDMAYFLRDIDRDYGDGKITLKQKQEAYQWYNLNAYRNIHPAYIQDFKRNEKQVQSIILATVRAEKRGFAPKVGVLEQHERMSAVAISALAVWSRQVSEEIRKDLADPTSELYKSGVTYKQKMDDFWEKMKTQAKTDQIVLNGLNYALPKPLIDDYVRIGGQAPERKVKQPSTEEEKTLDSYGLLNRSTRDLIEVGQNSKDNELRELIKTELIRRKKEK